MDGKIHLLKAFFCCCCSFCWLRPVFSGSGRTLDWFWRHLPCLVTWMLFMFNQANFEKGFCSTKLTLRRTPIAVSGKSADLFEDPLPQQSRSGGTIMVVPLLGYQSGSPAQMTRELIPCITETYPETPSFVKRKLALHSTSKFGLAEVLRAFLWPQQPVQTPSVRSKRAKSDQAFARFSDSNMRSCLHRLNSLVCVSFLLGTSLKLGGGGPFWNPPLGRHLQRGPPGGLGVYSVELATMLTPPFA